MVKIEKGIVVEYNGKYWGTEYDDGKSHSDNWVDIDNAKITDERFISKPEDLTYKGSYQTKELQRGKLVKVVRVTTITHEFE